MTMATANQCGNDNGEALPEPEMYIDYVILASREDEEKAEALRDAIMTSDDVKRANNGQLCRVDLIEEAAGDMSSGGYFDLVDKGIDVTSVVLAIITDQFLKADKYKSVKDEKAAFSYQMVLEKRLSKWKEDKVQLISIFMPPGLSKSRLLPSYISMMKPYGFEPGDRAARLMEKLAGFMKKGPFKERKRTVIRKLRVREEQRKLEDEHSRATLDNELEKIQGRMRELDIARQHLTRANSLTGSGSPPAPSGPSVQCTEANPLLSDGNGRNDSPGTSSGRSSQQDYSAERMTAETFPKSADS